MMSAFNLDSLLKLCMVTIFLTCHDDKHCYKGEKQYQDIIAPSRSHDDITTMTMMSSHNLDSNTAAMATTFGGEKSKGCLAVAKQASNYVGTTAFESILGFHHLWSKHAALQQLPVVHPTKMTRLLLVL